MDSHLTEKGLNSLLSKYSTNQSQQISNPNRISSSDIFHKIEPVERTTTSIKRLNEEELARFSNTEYNRLQQLKPEQVTKTNNPVYYTASTVDESLAKSSIPNIRSKELDKILQKYEDSTPKAPYLRPQTNTSYPGEFADAKRTANVSERQSFNERVTEKNLQLARETIENSTKNLRASPERGEMGTSFGNNQQFQSNRLVQNERNSHFNRAIEQSSGLENVDPTSDPLSQNRAIYTESESRPLSQRRKHYLEDTMNRKDSMHFTGNISTDHTRQAYHIGGARRQLETTLDQTPKRYTIPEISRVSVQDPVGTLSLLPSILESSGPKMRDERRSSAFKDAMKALQDRVKELEHENGVLRNKLTENQAKQVEAFEDIERRFRVETNLLKEKEKEIKEDVHKMQETNTFLQQELDQQRSLNVQQMNELKHTLQLLEKARQEHQAALTVITMYKKQIQNLEHEKNSHLEENAIEKNEFEKQVTDLVERVRLAEDNTYKLGNELKSSLEAKNEAESQLNKLVTDLSRSERREQQMIGELELKLNSAQKQISKMEAHNGAEKERHEKEMYLLKKKLSSLEEKSNTLVFASEDKMKDLVGENKRVKQSYKIAEKELSNFKKKTEKLEKTNQRLLREKIENEELIKQFMELVDEVVERLKKETALASFFKLILQKRHKLESEVSKLAEKSDRASVRPKANVDSLQKHRKLAKSRTGSLSKSKSKPSRLIMNELNSSAELSRVERPRYRKSKDIKSSSKSLPKNQGNTSLNNLSVTFDSRQSTPLKSSVERYRIPSLRKASHSAERKASHSAEKKARELQSSLTPLTNHGEDFSFLQRRSQQLNSRAELDQFRSSELTRARTHHNSFDDHTQDLRPQRDIRQTPTSGEYRHTFSRPLENSTHSQVGVEYTSTERGKLSDRPGLINTLGLPTYQHQNLSIDFARMTEKELSTEIVRLERATFELKREYQNLLAHTKTGDTFGNISDTKARLNNISNELKVRTELLQNLKKHQRNLLKSP